MAEVLVRAKPHWMDNFTQAQIDAMHPTDKRARDARLQIGDVITVKPDGWVWGKKECLPSFIVIKLPGVSVEDIVHLTQKLMSIVDEDFSIRLPKEDWDNPVIQAKLITDWESPTTPVAVPQEDNTYLIIGKRKNRVHLKRRKYQIPTNWLQPYLDAQTGVVTIELTNKQQAFLANLIEKTS